MQKEVLNFDKNLRKIRISQKLSQDDIAKVLNVHRNYTSGLEKRMRNHWLVTIQKGTKTIGVSTHKLIK